MRKTLVILAFALAVISTADAYSPARGRMMTRWGNNVNPDNVWQSYPRPQLVRGDWKNLNGMWDCSVTAREEGISAAKFDKEILVPFCIESSLSGVGQSFLPTDRLWYKRSFTIDKSWKGKNILLHFGAVDYRCEVFVNGKSVGKHVGGNNAFCLDISKAARVGAENSLVVSVTDPTSTETDTRGKQLLNPHGIWYTPVSGIWKTVWIEPVSATSIVRVTPETRMDGSVSFSFELRGAKGGETVEIEVVDGSKVIASYEGKAANAKVKVDNPELWTPDTPKLYHFNVALKRGKTVLDKASSYFALREVSIVKDVMGNARFALNGEPLFQFGPLDQGWWPDGLLTPPSEEAMLYDLQVLKKMGVNTIRKHIKIEPELYYYYTDSLGLMVWQDMPSGFVSDIAEQHVRPGDPTDWDAPSEHEAQFKYEFEEMFRNLGFFSCITNWIIFNEGWGQFRTEEMTAWVKALDGGRHIINSISGWPDRKVGDTCDAHNYPWVTIPAGTDCAGRIPILGEFGGLSLRVDGHMWNSSVGWVPYKATGGNDELFDSYERLMYDLEGAAALGLSGAIYTQTSDVETEVNGYMTYDREAVKFDEDRMNEIHSRLFKVKPARYVNIVERTSRPLIRDINPGDATSYDQEFEVGEEFSHLSLWLSTVCTVTVTLNGHEVFTGTAKHGRHMNQFNISDGAKYLQHGKNTIHFDIKNNTPRNVSEFRYELTGYSY